ncbi:GAF domain-containing protein [Thalassotalea euphylliae]|uniref:histidine kinase n=1 Tax=Thalassotalea euphylliae TaxID=1655234 RepID=A0A3E0TQG2_9GAMM|nr:GAF domain-containing sensor histidine kinase [Thalassotalea euphylliae]REL26282.1 GAF domain-containing protein [Thalassotalea euphylliae]
MTQNPISLTSISLNEQVAYWQRAMELEEGRNEVLRMVASGNSLESVLNTLCQRAQLYNPEMYCSVLLLDNDANTLHSIASSSLPDFYCQALNGTAIGMGVGSCGTAAFMQQRVIVEDINTHPYWVQFKGLALEAGLQACWSEPIIGQDGRVYGTFAMYYSTPSKPNEEDIKFIELSANLAAVVFENDYNRQQLLDANTKLSLTIDERTSELEATNKALANRIERQARQQIARIEEEKMITTNALLCGFAHEISTPIGNSLTTVSAIVDKLDWLFAALEEGTVSKKTFEQQLTQLHQLSEINKSNLIKADTLLSQFQQMDAKQVNDVQQAFELSTFFAEVKASLRGVLGDHQLFIDSQELPVTCVKECLWQVFYQLIENSIAHGFDDKRQGKIHISAMRKGNEIVINYQDDGCGIDAENTDKIFEPFYTTQRNSDKIGLGLTTVGSLLSNVLNGRIQLQTSPIGVRFEITLPGVELV